MTDHPLDRAIAAINTHRDAMAQVAVEIAERKEREAAARIASRLETPLGTVPWSEPTTESE